MDPEDWQDPQRLMNWLIERHLLQHCYIQYFHYWPISNQPMPSPCGFWCRLTLWPYIFWGQAAHGWKQAITPLAVFPLVWISSRLMSLWVSLHCKQWAAKPRDSSLLMLLNRILLSDGLIELVLLQTHRGTHIHKTAQLELRGPVERLVVSAEGQGDFGMLIAALKVWCIMGHVGAKQLIGGDD